ncbi:unnamed protein product [Adineta steineri]|uniref:Uncharacterized protein n=1 Tax=Adineta steineri TaxID=433720 RepID=A0A815RQN0_9BILA|nr:unnamed protein product [Adineta steineri]CAF3505442.1 unnamed protein product [Adineta steineri]
MFLNICIVFLVIFPNWIVATNVVSQGIQAKQIFLIIGLMLGSVLATFVLMYFIYFAIKCMKRTMIEPQYCIDDCDYDTYSQIKPVLTVSHMATSVKQCLLDLYISLIPFNWSHAQCVYDQSGTVNEKKDISF